MLYAFFALVLLIALLPCFYLKALGQYGKSLTLFTVMILSTGLLYNRLGSPHLESLTPLETAMKLETVRINLEKKEPTLQNLEALAFVDERLGNFKSAARIYENIRTRYGEQPHLLLKELDARLEAVDAFTKENHEALLQKAEKLMPFNKEISFYRLLLVGG